MSNQIARSFRALAPMLLIGSALATLNGCSKADDAAAVPNPTSQAQAAQSSIASARAAHDHRGPKMTEDDRASAPSASMAMGAPDGATGSMSPSAPSGAAPTGMARMLGQPPMASGSNDGGLPPAIGAPHLYHLGADTFFLNRASAIGLTSEQQKKLAALKESAAMAYANTQRKMDQGEQDLWGLSSSEAPDLAKIDAKIGEIARLGAQQRSEFIRTMGEAVGVLSDAQRRGVAQGGPMQPGAMAPAPSASGMSMEGGAPSPGGMEMGGKKKMPMGGAAPPPSGGSMPGMPIEHKPGMPMGASDAGPGGMGHM